MFYTGVGSRNISFEENRILQKVGEYMAKEKYILRSGKAAGADTAFALGAQRWAGKINNFIPWSNFENPSFPFNYYDINFEKDISKELQKYCLDTASKIHPAWKKCGYGAQKLHARNILQVEGYNDEPNSVLLVACSDWDNKDKLTINGGTRTAWELAKKYSIPVLNIRDMKEKEVFEWLENKIQWEKVKGKR